MFGQSQSIRKSGYNLMSKSYNKAQTFIQDEIFFSFLLMINFITSCVFLHRAESVHTEIKKTGVDSPLTKLEEEKLTEVIWIQIVVNTIFNVIIQYKSSHVITRIFGIIWFIFSFVYFFMASNWKELKVKRKFHGENIFIWMFVFLCMTFFSYVTMCYERRIMKVE